MVGTWVKQEAVNGMEHQYVCIEEEVVEEPVEEVVEEGQFNQQGCK